MDCFERLEAYFQANQAPFGTQHHPVAYTARDVATSEHVSGALIAKVVMVVADDKPVMLVLLASRRIDEPLVAAVLGARDVRLATEDELAGTFPDCEVGAMPPFGNLYGLPVYVDTRLAEDDTIIFQAGSHSETMSLKYVDFERLVKPTVARLVTRELTRH